MSIHINLLAEAQIAEDLRRRDPVKRAIFFGVILVVMTLVWSLSLQLKVRSERARLAQAKSRIDELAAPWQEAQNSQKKIDVIKDKLVALDKLSSASFVQGKFLNDMQLLKTEGVQLTRINLAQSYYNVPGTANTTNNSHITQGRPAATTEKVVMTLDARDSSASPGDQINKYKVEIAGLPYIKGMLNPTNAVQLTKLMPPQIGPDGRPYVAFTLESIFPDKIR